MVSAGAHIIPCIFPRWSEFKRHSPLNPFTQIFLKKIICLWYSFFILAFFYLLRIRFVINYYRAQLRRLKRKIIKLRSWRIKLRSQWTPSPSPFLLPRNKVGFSGEMKGIIQKRLLLQWGGGLRSFFFLCFIIPRGRGLRFAWGFAREPAVSLH